MPSKQLDIPPAAAKQFLDHMKAFHAAGQRDGDEIAATAAWLLEQHLPKGTKLRLSDVKQMFHELGDHIGYSADRS